MDCKKIICPRCGAETEYSLQNPFRPFCSERCRTIDLGAWASENYRIAILNSEEIVSEDEENKELSKKN